MAPGGHRRGKGGREKRELSLGDLVLAKVKGFPAWPAKISRPEDWDRTPDPKKYFVLFFGTNEIAFVAPADIQAFTSEVKDKLLAKGQAKSHKFFAPAVEDICEEFEQLQHRGSGNLEDSNCDASMDTDENALENGLKDGRSIDGPSRETDDTRSSNSCKAGEISSPLKSPKRKKKKNKPLDDEANSQNEVVLALSCSNEEVQIDEEREVRKDFSSLKTSLSRESDGGKKAQMNGQKSGQTTTVSKKKPKEGHSVHKNGVSTASSKPRENSVNSTKVRKMATSSSIRESYKERKQDIDTTNEKKKELNEHRKSLDEDDFPSTKRRREDSESLSKSVIKTVENKTGKLPAEKKNDELHGSIAKLPVTQLHAKRRAVRIYDDGDDERPKTPVHGRSVSKASGSVGLKKKENNESNSVKVLNEHSRQKSDQSLDKKVKKVVASLTPHSNTKPIERVTLKKDKLILGSPRNSPMTDGDSKRQVLEPKKTDLTQKKLQTGPSKGPNFVSDGLGNTQSSVKSEKSKTISSGQSRNIESISTHDTDIVRMDSGNDNSFSGGRMEASADDGTKHFFGSKISESSSMRTLIAAAQASRKQAVSHNNNIHRDENNTLSTPSIEQPRRSESPLLRPKSEGDYSNTFKMSSQQDLLSDKKPGNEEYEERRVEDTEAAVARDAFEGMIETLSRTRDSIGRATRLAIDCAKYGIANEVVELLIRKLETESDDHRKIDLFFLVDSITQGSHKGKGIAGSSYIPAVEAALPRLIGAAAPRGPSAHENRRQCLKVLKLWMERNILPESLLRRHIDGLGIPNEDNFMLKRPSRAERAVDDPIREMEGMLVDEYGSNVTSQLPGLLSANLFEDDEDDEDDKPGPSYAEPDIESPIGKLPVTLDSETCVTPSDRINCILEDVDGELEMEDVSVQPKDEPFSCGDGSVSDEYMETCSEEVSPFHGSPPLPLYSPPSTPPLPSSPPPSPSPSPPPSSFLSLPQSLPVPPSGPPQPSFSPPMISQQFHLPQSSIPNVSPNLSYQQPLPLENCSTPSGNQFVQIPPSSTFRHNEVHVNSQAPQQNQHFQTRNSNPQFPQRPFHPIPPPMSQASHYVYHNSPANQPSHHPYPRPYSSPNLRDGPRRYIPDDQWRRPTNEFKRENSRGAWMGKGGSGAPYGHEGHFSTPFERQAMNKGGFHPSTPIPGHAVSPPLPFRPDMPHIDRWRP